MTAIATHRIEIDNPFYASPVFHANMSATEADVVNSGGTWSGKTYSILQVLFLLTVTTRAYDPDTGKPENIITTIVGQDVPNLTKGAITDFENLLPAILEGFPESVHHRFAHNYNKTTKTYRFANGARLEFSSFKNWQDAKAGKRHYLFINEANGIGYKIYQQLRMRTRIRTFLDFNPDAPFWVHKKLLGKDGVKFVYSNFTHNKFVPQDLIREFKALGRENPEWWKVYGEGRTGQIEGVVFPSVRWIGAMPDSYKREAYGMDFGYTNSYTTLVRVVISEGKLYAEVLLYARGMTGADIAAFLDEIRFSKKKYLVADNAPETIETIRRQGYRKIVPAYKPPGSVETGIDLIKGYGVLHLVDNQYWKAEQLAYKWIDNKMSGDATRTPVKDPCHAFDALRYAMQDLVGVKKKSAKAR